MSKIKSAESVDTEVELLICWGMITSDRIVEQLSLILSPDLLVTEQAKYVVKWSIEHYRKYKEAPRAHIFDILSVERSKRISDDAADLIEDLLTVVSNVDDNAPSEDYVLQRAEVYIKERSASMLCEDVSALLSRGQVQEAEGLISAYKAPTRPIAAGDDLFSPEFWNEEEEERQVLFELPGALGEMIGPIERDSFISLIAPEKTGKCLHEDSMIMLADGRLKPIRDVVRDKDKYILTFDEEQRKFIPGRVVDWWDNGKKDCLRVRFKSGRSVIVTPHHPFLSPDGWHPIAEIGVGGFVANPKKVSIQGGVSQPAHIMRLLGYLIADGGLTQGVSWTKKDEETRQDFFRCVSLAGSSITQSSCDPNVVYVVRGKESGKNIVHALLKECGLLGKKSIDKHTPEMVLKADNASIAEFLCGLYSGDGWVTEKQIGLGLSNKGLITAVQGLLTRFGIVSRLYQKKNGSWHLMIHDSENLVRFSENIPLVSYKQRRIEKYLPKWRSMPRKSFLDRIPVQIAEVCLAEVHHWIDQNKISVVRQSWCRSYFQIHEQLHKGKPTMRQNWLPLKEIPVVRDMLDDAVFWDEVISIEELPDQYTYDLSVEHHHNFIADNCLVHNTWYLMYMALEALKAGRNVLFISAGDMTKHQVRARLKHMLAGRDPRRPKAQVRRPVIDCYYNQIGDCPLGERTSSLVGGSDARIETLMEEFPDHKVCRKCCRSKKNGHHFVGRPWYRVVDVDSIPIEEACADLQKRARGGQCKILCVPPKTINIAQIEAQLDLHKQQGFVPDVVIVDYADILDDEPGSRKEDMRNRINISWMAMRRLSQERQCCFLTATQAKLEARKKSKVDQWDTSEDKRKLAHVTAMIALNQTPAEKRDGIMRVSVLAARDRDFDLDYNVEVLQCLDLGKPVLYSYPHRDPPSDDRKKRTSRERRMIRE